MRGDVLGGGRGVPCGGEERGVFAVVRCTVLVRAVPSGWLCRTRRHLKSLKQTCWVSLVSTGISILGGCPHMPVPPPVTCGVSVPSYERWNIVCFLLQELPEAVAVQTESVKGGAAG